MLNMYRVDFVINGHWFSTRAFGNEEVLVLLNGLSDSKIEFNARKEYSA
jgi:hypothetical protein